MRTIVIIVLLLAVLIGGAAVFLAVTTADEPVPLRFPLPAGQRALLDHVPATAEAFALVPSAAAVHGRLLANGITREAIAAWSSENDLPAPWLLGNADVVAWKEGETTAFAIHLDGLRAMLIRAWLLFASTADARWDGSTLLLHADGEAPRSRDLDSILLLTAGLADANALVVQREGERGAFPPLDRPAINSIAIDASHITVISRARSSDLAPAAAAQPGRFPADAMLAASFTSAPRILGDLDRLVGLQLDGMLGRGGSAVIFDVDRGTFLPRPRGVLTFPATDEARARLGELDRVIALVGETRDTGTEIVVALDRDSMPRYLGATFVEGQWPVNQWALRIDPARLVPVLRSAGDNLGLRLAAPRTYRAARDLRRWIGELEKASSIEAGASAGGGIEELRVQIAAK